MTWLTLLGCAMVKGGVETPALEEAVVLEIPTPGALPSWLPGTPEVETLENGLSLWVLNDPSIPLVSARLVLPGGTVTDPPEAWGFSWLAAQMLEESTEKRTTAEMADAFKLLGAEMSVSAQRMAVVASMDILSERFEEGLALLAEAMLMPAFAEDDWERVKGLHLESIERRREEGRFLAQEVADLSWFGVENPMAWPARGSRESVARVYRERVRDSLGEWIVPKGSTLVVVGDADMDRVRSGVETYFAGWTGERSARVVANHGSLGPNSSVPESRFLLVDLPGSAQTAIRVIGKGPGVGDEAFSGAGLSGIVLGGSFTSRLNSLLREEKGYTYGARASFSATGPVGVFVASTSVQTDVTTPALNDLVGELADFGQAFTSAEARKARAQELADALDTGESRSSLADTHAESASEGRGPGYFAAQLERTLATGSEDMSQAVADWFEPQDLLIVLAGDSARIGEGLEEAGFSFQVVEAPR